ncbi:MAG: Rrf2 family transcriptional regulator [Deltaproteobacteria bacterium]|nr:Rrf2 family transcriptional regulator [Deltaproteobacteria bacterium]
MKLSTRGRYGVRMMLELALHYGEGPILLRDIAERQGISEKYLWQLINPLKTTGLVNSLRGAHGGYVLAKAPEAISLKAILQILEGSLCLVDCVDNPALCERSPSCISRDIWGEASKNMQQTLEDTTLAAMVERQKEKLKNETG